METVAALLPQSRMPGSSSAHAASYATPVGAWTIQPPRSTSVVSVGQAFGLLAP